MEFRRVFQRSSRIAAVLAVLLVTLLFSFFSPQLTLSASAPDTDVAQVDASLLNAAIGPETSPVYYQTRIIASGTWDNGDAAARPEDLTLRLFANGEEIASKTISESALSWNYEFGDFETYHLGVPVKYTLVSDPVQSYTMQIAQGTEEAGALRFNIKGTHSNVVFSRRIIASTATGDDKHMVFFGVVCLLSILLLALYFMRGRRK